MTSSQPVTTPQALNFTPDNKRAYAYSGSTNVDNNETDVLTFSTNSEYIDGHFKPIYFSTSSSDDASFIVKFNDVSVFICTVNSATSDTPYQDVRLIIPPFTDVSISAYNRTDTSTIAVGCSITGLAFGMIETGYQ